MTGHSTEKCFEEAQDSGYLKLHQKGLRKLPVCVEDYELLDVLNVDISKNRFCELPEEILEFSMMETLNCARNFIKTLPDMGNLSSLTHININQNQLQTLPVFPSQLPLKILKASHNRISVIPSEIGALSRLQLLDLSCNELTKLPSTIGDLGALRALDVHRNNIITLPDELSKLKYLQRLDFSSNKISVIPPAFRLIQSLVRLNLQDNPLTSPPAKVCIKGRIHLIKYLGMIAQQEEKRWTIMSTDPMINRSPSLSITSNASRNEITTMNQEGEQHIVYEPPDGESLHEQDAPEDAPDFDDNRSVKSNRLALNLVPQDNLSIVDTIDKDKIDTIAVSPIDEKPMLPPKPSYFNQDLGEKSKSVQEKGKLTPTGHRTPTTPTSIKTFVQNDDFDSASLDRAMFRNIGQNRMAEWEARFEKKPGEDNIDELTARKELLMKNKEEILESKLRLESIKSKTLPHPPSSKTLPHPPLSQESELPFDGIKKRTHIATKNNKKFLDGASNYTMRRFYDSAKEEFIELEKLRTVIEEKLRIKLPDDLPASLSDGIVLCHFVNHLKKGTILNIHVPSSGVPKLNMTKCQMNVDAFLDACRKIGVGKIDVCAPPDILEEKSPTNLCRTVHALLVALGVSTPTNSIVSPLSPR